MSDKTKRSSNKSKMDKHVQSELEKTTGSKSNDTYDTHYDDILKNVVCFENKNYRTPSPIKKRDKPDIFEKCREIGALDCSNPKRSIKKSSITSSNVRTPSPDKPTRDDKQKSKSPKNGTMTTDLLEKFVQTYDDME